MNNKGFTLVELIATILVLALLMSIGAYTIINTFNATKEKNIESLIAQIKSAAENYVMECTYSKESVYDMFGVYENNITSSEKNARISSASDFCKKGNKGTLTLGDLVTHGYLTGNGKKQNGEYTLYNPNVEELISECKIKSYYATTNGKFVVKGFDETPECTKILKYNKTY